MSKSAVSAPIAARDLFDHVLLSILWGASFLFMRIAVPEFGPWPLMGLRCLIGAITLVALLVWYREIKRIGDNFVLGMGMGVLNSAIPFVLLAYAALAVSSGLLSIINAMAPFWGALFGWLWLRSPLTRWQALGLVLGFAGVVVLMITSTNSLQVCGFCWCVGNDILWVCGKFC